jgi:hypothetical protein
MKKFFMIILFLLFGGSVYSFENRIFSERIKQFDGFYYTDLGHYACFENKSSSLKLKNGVMFSSLKEPMETGNHEWFYTTLSPSFKITDIFSVYFDFTTITPFEGNDFGIEMQKSYQMLGFSIGSFSFDKTKWTNGNFYTQIKYTFDILDFNCFNSYVYEGERGYSTFVNYSNDKLIFSDLNISKWIAIPLNKNLDLCAKLQITPRYSFTNSDIVVNYGASLGLICN